MEKRIKNIAELKRLAKNGLDCHIRLVGGGRSSKFIDYDKEVNRFFIINLIDESEQYLTPAQLLDENITNIGKALCRGALFAD